MLNNKNNNNKIKIKEKVSKIFIKFERIIIRYSLLFTVFFSCFLVLLKVF